jgi:predicted esterase
MISLFETLGFSAKRKVILMGYDLGGAISLSSALHPKLSKAIAQLIVFHPTWTDSI